MKENKYDHPEFFNQYKQMRRSVEGLEGAGEWYILKELLPDFKGKRVLDLGCGFGWHCFYAARQGAGSVLGTDISSNMIELARDKNAHPAVEYRQIAIEDFEFTPDSFDIVISSLAFHYISDFEKVCKHIYDCLIS